MPERNVRSSWKRERVTKTSGAEALEDRSLGSIDAMDDRSLDMSIVEQVIGKKRVTRNTHSEARKSNDLRKMRVQKMNTHSAQASRRHGESPKPLIIAQKRRFNILPSRTDESSECPIMVNTRPSPPFNLLLRTTLRCAAFQWFLLSNDMKVS